MNVIWGKTCRIITQLQCPVYDVYKKQIELGSVVVTFTPMNSLWFLLTVMLWVGNAVRSLRTGLELDESCVFININLRHMGDVVSDGSGGDGILLPN